MFRMIEAQPITADAPSDEAAEHLKVLRRMREMGMERLEAFSERVQKGELSKLSPS